MKKPTLFPIRQQQADDTRLRLLEAAWEMVREAGPASFSMRQLAARAEVAVGLPFAHFKTKEDLLDQLRIRYWDSIDQEIKPVTDNADKELQGRSFEEQARLGLQRVIEYALREQNLYNLIALNPGTTLTNSVFARELQTAQPFVEFLTRGQAAGEFEFRGDPVVFALALWTSVQGYIERMGARLPKLFRPYQEKVLDEIFESFFARIRRQAPAPRSKIRRKRS